jgi:hypothetical protein
MSFKRVETLGDVVRFGLVVTITCLGCGRSRKVPVSALYARFRANTRLRDIGRRLRCSGIDLQERGCGHLGARVDFTFPEPPTPPDNGGGNVVDLLPRLLGSEQFWDHAAAQRRRRR